MSRTIDCHTHILSEDAMRALAKESPSVAPIMTKRGDPACKLTINGAVVQDPFPRELWDTEQRLRDMDAHGVDIQVLAPTVFTFFYDREPALGLACAMLQNDEIGREVKRHPACFLGLAGVPLQAPELAARELRRAGRAWRLHLRPSACRRGGGAARLILLEEPRRPAVRDHGRGREPGVRRRARTPSLAEG